MLRYTLHNEQMKDSENDASETSSAQAPQQEKATAKQNQSGTEVASDKTVQSKPSDAGAEGEPKPENWRRVKATW